MGLEEEWREAREWVARSMEPAQDRYVNLFETTIRVVGGLLGAFHLSQDELFLHRAVRSWGVGSKTYRHVDTPPISPPPPPPPPPPRRNWDLV